jgi:hypothetical protein
MSSKNKGSFMTYETSLYNWLLLLGDIIFINLLQFNVTTHAILKYPSIDYCH